MQKLMLVPALAASTLLVGQAASAEVVALYNFEEFDTAANAWDANAGPYANAALATLGTASSLTNVGLATLEAQTVRTINTVLPSFALLSGANGTQQASPAATDDYLGFTFTATAATNLTSLTFDLGAANVSDDETMGLDSRAQVFYSIDGGSFTSIGAEQQRDTGPGPADVFTGMINSVIDLSSISLLPGQTIELRLAFADNRGYATTAGASYIDNITLNAVPEPASLALLGLGGLAIAARRRA